MHRTERGMSTTKYNCAVSRGQNYERIVTFIITGGRFCLANTHPNEEGPDVLWGHKALRGLTQQGRYTALACPTNQHADLNPSVP